MGEDGEGWGGVGRWRWRGKVEGEEQSEFGKIIGIVEA